MNFVKINIVFVTKQIYVQEVKRFMEVFTTDRIRNVVLLGHGGAGKTSLVEAMAYLSGQTGRMGKISDGNTVSDFDKEEIKRSFSIQTTVIPILWDNTKINILDTPGYFDFVGEAEEAVSVGREKHGKCANATNCRVCFL